jgi:phage-related protein
MYGVLVRQQAGISQYTVPSVRDAAGTCRGVVIGVRDAFSIVRDSFGNVRGGLSSVSGAFRTVRGVFSNVRDTFSNVRDAFSSLGEGFSSLRGVVQIISVHISAILTSNRRGKCLTTY